MLDKPILSGLLLLAVAPLSIGCGDDSGVPPPCVGHECADGAINLPEGGEIRLELIGQKDGPQELRVGAWFATAQTPNTRPMPRPPSEWNTPGAQGLCADMRSNTIWPTGDPESRVYADAGDTVVMTNGTATLTLNKGLNVEDELNNYHEIAYLASIDPRVVTVDSEYSVQLAGGVDLPAQTFETSIYLPENFVTSFPDMDQTVVMPDREDFPFIWDAPPNKDEFEFAFAAFTDQIDPIVFCIGPNNGQLVVPKEMIDLLPPAGVVQLGVLDHRAFALDLGGGDRRVDLVSINCKASAYSISTDGF